VCDMMNDVPTDLHSVFQVISILNRILQANIIIVVVVVVVVDLAHK
jgi:hypothetical protein